MDVLITLTVISISQCIRISHHHFVYLKYIQVLFAKYSPTKLEKNSCTNNSLFIVGLTYLCNQL